VLLDFTDRTRREIFHEGFGAFLGRSALPLKRGPIAAEIAHHPSQNGIVKGILNKTLPVVVLSSVLALGSGGCSYLFVQPLAPNYQSGDPVTCTSNVAAPVVDTIFTVLDTVELVGAGSNSNVQNRSAVLTGATLGIILWGTSAIYGYRHTSECSEAQNDTQGSYRPYRRRAPPPAWAPPAPPRQPSPPPPAPPGPAPDEAAPAPAPSVTVPSAPAAPQQRDEDGPG
jgi:hypothetical protein